MCEKKENITAGQQRSYQKKTAKPDLMEHIFLAENMDINSRIVKSKYAGVKNVHNHRMTQSFAEERKLTTHMPKKT